MWCFSGPESWWVHFPSAAGTEQSPVDIRREEAEFLPCLKNNPLKFCYEERSHKQIRNNGHTCIIDVGGMSCEYAVYVMSQCVTFVCEMVVYKNLCSLTKIFPKYRSMRHTYNDLYLCLINMVCIMSYG